MKLWLVEILVRLGVAVIADGRCRPRWYGSDQCKVCGSERFMWSHGHFTGILRRKLTPSSYYLMRRRVTGSNWQHKQYTDGMLRNLWPVLDATDRNILAGLTMDNYRQHMLMPVVARVLA